MILKRIVVSLLNNNSFQSNCFHSRLLLSTLSKQSVISSNSFEHNKLPLENTETKLLRVAIIGMPNAGKSTLINSIVDRKVCPTSKKVHTTQKRSHAIITEDLTQIVFLDTPGVVSINEFKKYKLNRSFTKDCAKSLNEADIIGVIHDVSNLWTRERLDIKLIKLLEEQRNKRSFLVLNKIDTLKSKRKLLDITRIVTESSLNSICFDSKKPQNDMKGWPNFNEIFMISAITGDGIDDIKKYLFEQAKPGEWMYDMDKWTNDTFDDIIVRTVQATLLDFLPQEIPYNLKTQMEFFEITEEDKIQAVVQVHCPSDRIQKLVVGVGNGKLRQIIEKAQKDLFCTFDQPVRLQIVVNSKDTKK